jgi:hypothetical protein
VVVWYGLPPHEFCLMRENVFLIDTPRKFVEIPEEMVFRAFRYSLRLNMCLYMFHLIPKYNKGQKEMLQTLRNAPWVAGASSSRFNLEQDAQATSK